MNKTWVNFQDMFTSAHETYETLTAQAGGYHGANNVQTKFYNETAEAFANLAMTVTADKDLLSTLTNTNSTITNQLATKDKIIAALQEQLRSSRAPTTAPAPPTVSI
jgi:1,2-phenylacetyl-CoA epoxidase catalytic subunit